MISRTECIICKIGQSSGHELLGKKFIEKAIFDGDPKVNFEGHINEDFVKSNTF